MSRTFGPVAARRFVRRTVDKTAVGLALEPLETRLQPSFLTPTYYATDQSPRGMAAADFNEDGNLDLAVATFGSHAVGVHMGSEAGTFGPAVESGAGLAARQLVAGDFNEDGHVDLAFPVISSTARVGILLGEGDGTFESAALYPVGPSPQGIAMGDFDGDSHLDLVTANQGSQSGSISLLRGTGLGTFQDAVTFARPQTGGYVAAADFNGDGALDLAATNTVRGIGILMNTGTGSFQETTVLGVRHPGRVTVGDLNGDGFIDLAATHSSNGVSTWLGRGDGLFDRAGSFATDKGALGLSLGDFDNDGNLDVVTANAQTSTASVLFGNGDGTLDTARNYVVAISAYVPEALAADFNGDGYDDFAMSGGLDHRIGVLLYNPGRGVTNPPLMAHGLKCGKLTFALLNWSLRLTINLTG